MIVLRSSTLTVFSPVFNSNVLSCARSFHWQDSASTGSVCETIVAAARFFPDRSLAGWALSFLCAKKKKKRWNEEKRSDAILN